jgi:hypothetical protein
MRCCSCWVGNVDEAVGQTQVPRQVLTHRRRAVALGGMVAAGQEGHPGLAGDVGLRFGDLAGEESIGTGSDGSLGGSGLSTNSKIHQQIVNRLNGH